MKNCQCGKCQNERFLSHLNNGNHFPMIYMALCPECGNKRCPKASDHENGCTGSNEPFQPGSAYT